MKCKLFSLLDKKKTTFEDVHVFYASKIDEVTYSEGLDLLLTIRTERFPHDKTKTLNIMLKKVVWYL